MLRRTLLVRIAGPTVLVSFLLLGLTIAAAIYLYNEQAVSGDVLGENVSSVQVAHALLNSLRTQLELTDPNPAVNTQVKANLKRAEELADKAEEQQLVGRLKISLGHYWASIENAHQLPEDARASGLEQAKKILQDEAIPVCRQLVDFNLPASAQAAEAHRQKVHWLIGGLVVVGTMGAIAGLFLGYSTARGLKQSIYHLSVRVQDAANKLGQDLPPVSVTEEGDLTHLHEQMRGVVHEIEQVVKDLQEREHEVLRAEQLAAVGQLAAGLAHEMRNPLTSIKLLIQTNREEANLGGTPAEDLAVIEREIRRMERSLQNFLDFARPPKPDRKRMNLIEAIERTLALVGGRARKQHVEIRFHPNEASIPVEADPDLLQQVLVNLALNALDVMPGGGVLEVGTECPRRANGVAEVEVQVLDTGPGIDPEMESKLFQPFVSNKETGLGLGLVISRRIAEGHGGSLVGMNRPGGGACFCLRLPLSAENPVPAPPLETVHASPPGHR